MERDDPEGNDRMERDDDPEEEGRMERDDPEGSDRIERNAPGGEGRRRCVLIAKKMHGRVARLTSADDHAADARAELLRIYKHATGDCPKSGVAQTIRTLVVRSVYWRGCYRRAAAGPVKCDKTPRHFPPRQQ